VSCRTRGKRREKSQKASRPTPQESGVDGGAAGGAGGVGATIWRFFVPKFVNIELGLLELFEDIIGVLFLKHSADNNVEL